MMHLPVPPELPVVAPFPVCADKGVMGVEVDNAGGGQNRFLTGATGTLSCYCE